MGAGATQQLPRRARLRAVSILTRPWGRVQRYPQWSDAPSRLCFNPHPHLGAGATSRRVSLPASFSCFNPHPPLGAGATLKFVMAAPAVYRFQSSPAPEGGCNRPRPRPSRCCAHRFNPHPPVGAGATPRGPDERPSHRRSFNPHPPVGAGATKVAVVIDTSGSMFQSSPARGGGCNTVRRALKGRAHDVSILTRPWGRVQRAARRSKRFGASTFQSSPARGGGCNTPAG